MLELVIVADDLSGAAEAAAGFLLRTTRITIALDVTADTTARVLAIDTHSRRQTPREAAASVTAAVAGRTGVRVLKKVDSLLRGNIAAEVAALRDALGAAPVVATALPSAGRTVRNGVLLVNGVPLHETAMWSAETRPPPRTVAEALHPLPTVAIPLATVRSVDLARALDAARDVVAVCDAETDADLLAIHQATPAHRLLVGSAGLCAAVAQTFPGSAVFANPAAADAVLVVVGSAAPSIGAQLAHLKAESDAYVQLDPHELLRGRADLDLGDAGLAVVTLGECDVDPALAQPLVSALARVVAPVAADGRALILTGGETARTVLDRLGVTRLRPLHACDGAVVSSTDTGQVVVTRPGSFGTPGSLAELARAVLLRPHRPKEPA